MEDLISKVIVWGKEKGIDNPFSQYAKINEELGEIAHELTRGRFDSDEMRDAIGDTMVTLIIFANILGLDLEECLDEAYEVISHRTGKTEGGIFIKSDDIE